MPVDGGSGLVGIIVFVLIVAVAVVVGITLNEHLQSWVDGSSSTSG